MSPFILEVPAHAEARLRLRKITRNKIRKCIIHGNVTENGRRGRTVQRYKFGSRILEIVTIRRMGGYLLVTCYWKGKTP